MSIKKELYTQDISDEDLDTAVGGVVFSSSQVITVEKRPLVTYLDRFDRNNAGALSYGPGVSTAGSDGPGGTERTFDVSSSAASGASSSRFG